MKKLVAGVVAVMVGATTVLAAPAPPVFNKPVKVGDGYIGNRLNTRMVFSGKTVYAGFSGPDGGVRIAKSENGGVSWGTPLVLQAPSPEVSPDGASLRLAISDDPNAKGKKIVHAAWQAVDPAKEIVYYAYLTERSKKPSWSKPQKVDLGPRGDVSGTSLAVSASGAINIVQGMKHVMATSPGAQFSAPQALPKSFGGATVMVTDSANNLYATYVDENRKLKLTKKGAADARWSDPVTVHEATLGDLSNNHALVVLNPTTYYVGVYTGYAGKGEAFVMVTTDGGATWSKRNVFTDEPEGDNSFNLAVSADKVISFVSESYDSQGKSTIKVWRSDDNGATWSKPVTIKGEKQPNVGLDPVGKLNILVMDEVTKPENGKLLWIKEK